MRTRHRAGPMQGPGAQGPMGPGTPGPRDPGPRDPGPQGLGTQGPMWGTTQIAKNEILAIATD